MIEIKLSGAHSKTCLANPWVYAPDWAKNLLLVSVLPNDSKWSENERYMTREAVFAKNHVSLSEFEF